ncbi:MAG: helix-turn-helix transcriptional regulator [Oscillospiraceae bacterium]|nr:helix-turn-helix transcriptional regulator [Oscillospiraceae bacterium]
MDNMKTGALIAQMRKEKGMTQKALADSIGVSNAAVSKWETGKGFPDISLLEPLSNALGLTVSEILAGERLEDTSLSDTLVRDMADISSKEQAQKAKLYNWLIAITTAVLYLTVSLITGRWEITWIIWIVYCIYRVVSEFIIRK